MTLPFLSPPASPEFQDLGTAVTGVLRFPILGGLTVAEADTINELLADRASSFRAAAQAADAIAKAEDISLVEAFQLVEDSLSGRDLEDAANEIRLRHAAQIENVAKVYAVAGQMTMAATVTALIRHRLDQPAWAMKDTAGLHRVLFQAIWGLAQQEEAAEANPVTPPTESELGKLPPVNGSASPSTGSKSSGTSRQRSRASSSAAALPAS